MEEDIRKPLRENIDEMFIGPFGSSLKNESFVEKKDAYCMVYEQKHAIQKTMNVETRYVTKEKYEELKRFNIKGGDIIVSCRGTIGETFVIPLNAPIGIMHPSIMKIRLKEDVYDRQYFNLLLIKYLREHEAEANGSGVKMAISAKELSEVCFPVPPIDIQKDIVSLFENVDNIISSRKQQLLKFDELVKSRFIEMFGDLVIGDKVSTNKHKIGDIATVTKLAGFEFTKYIQYKEQGDIIMLRGLNCKKGHLVLDDIKWIDKETSDLLPRSKLYYGDILMTYAGTIGDIAMVDADNKYHLAPNVAKITLTDKIAYNPVFLIHLFMYTNDYIMTFASVVAQASINMEKIRNFEYYFPSAEQQNQFATFVEQVDKSKFEIQKSLEKLETLKKALMQKYFG